MSEQAFMCISPQERDTLERILHDVCRFNGRPISGLHAERLKSTIGFAAPHQLVPIAGSIAIDGVEFVAKAGGAA